VIYRLNLQTARYEYFSPRDRDVYGYSAEEMMAMDAGDTLAAVHPDDMGRVGSEIGGASANPATAGWNSAGV